VKDDLVKVMRESINEVVHIDQDINGGGVDKVVDKVIEKLKGCESWQALVTTNECTTLRRHGRMGEES
jgi:hypothetical protein